MEVSLVMRWYDRDENLNPDWDKEHRKTFTADTPAGCYEQYCQWVSTLDLARNTIPVLDNLY